MIQKPLARRMMTAARRFEEREPWLDYTEEHVIALRIPGEPHPVYAIVLGAAGKEFGLATYRGERALEQLHHVARGPQPPFVAPMLLLGFDPIGVVAPEFRELAQAGGADGRVIPSIVSIQVGGKVRPPTANEVRLMAQVVEALLFADGARVLSVRPFDTARGGRMAQLTVVGEGGKVENVTADLITVAPPAGIDATALPLPWPMPELPLLEAHYVVAFEQMAAEVNDRPNRAWFVVVLEPETDMIVGLQAVPLDAPDDLDAPARALAEIFAEPRHGEPGLPRRITFTNERLAKSLAALTQRGITVGIADHHPGVQSMLRDLHEHMARLASDDPTAPAAHDEKSWIVHHGRLLDRLNRALEQVDLFAFKPVATFFGDRDVLEALDDEEMVVHRTAYRDWYVTCFRAKAGRPTIAERLLAGELPEAERCLLEARVAARPGLYRVVQLEPPRLVLRDVLGDHEAEVDDATLATSTVVGAALPASLGDANGHRFVLPIGPLVRPEDLASAKAYLAESFGTFPSADVQRRPELLATLWRWSLTRHAERLAREEPPAEADER